MNKLFKQFDKAMADLQAHVDNRNSDASQVTDKIDSIDAQIDDVRREYASLAAAGNVEEAETLSARMDQLKRRKKIHQTELAAIQSEQQNGFPDQVQALVEAHVETISAVEKKMTQNFKKLIELKEKMEGLAGQQKDLVRRCMNNIRQIHKAMVTAGLEPRDLKQLSQGYSVDAFTPKLGVGINPRVEIPKPPQDEIDFEEVYDHPINNEPEQAVVEYADDTDGPHLNVGETEPAPSLQQEAYDPLAYR